MKERHIEDGHLAPRDQEIFWETIFKFSINRDVELIDPDGNLIITSRERAAELMQRWEKKLYAQKKANP